MPIRRPTVTGTAISVTRVGDMNLKLVIDLEEGDAFADGDVEFKRIEVDDGMIEDRKVEVDSMEEDDEDLTSVTSLYLLISEMQSIEYGERLVRNNHT